MNGRRTIRVKSLARVEGEGGLVITLRGDRVEDVRLTIHEPPRLFEALLIGRHISEAPDITSRICGICPVAYQMSAVHAIERALGLRIHPAVRALRRLFYCGEWIESHALHVFLLHLPDFLGYQDAIAMAGDHRELVERGLRIKQIGNRILTTLGGREIHPVSAAVGGFYKVPSKAAVMALRDDLMRAGDASVDTARAIGNLVFPELEQDYEFVALTHPAEYPLNEGRLVSNRGLDIDAAAFEDHIVEEQVRHSNALHASIRARGSYLVGPLARVNLNVDRLPARAREALHLAGGAVPCRNPFRSIAARVAELVFACDEAVRIIDAYEPPPQPRVEPPSRAGVGHAITEAPRGILYQRYAFDERGLILTARIVPPTSQNQRRIEEDLRRLAPDLVALPLEEATWRCEQAVRNYDPCISCATHFLTVRFEDA